MINEKIDTVENIAHVEKFLSAYQWVSIDNNKWLDMTRKCHFICNTELAFIIQSKRLEFIKMPLYKKILKVIFKL